jgi:hypothetical protein
VRVRLRFVSFVHVRDSASSFLLHCQDSVGSHDKEPKFVFLVYYYYHEVYRRCIIDIKSRITAPHGIADVGGFFIIITIG